MLRRIQQHLEHIYRLGGAPDVRDFLVDQDAVAQLMGGAREAEEWVFVREEGGELDLGVFIAEEHLTRTKEANSPQELLHDSFHSFCVVTEGVSHFLMLVERASAERPVCMLELEAQAEVDKYVSARLHAPDRATEWHTRLFKHAALASDLSEDERRRYRDAGRLAAGFCAALDRCHSVAALLHTVRRFRRASRAQRLDEMQRLAS